VIEGNGLIYAICSLLALVVLSQVAFFQRKERKLHNIILGFTGWMENQEKINQALSAALVEVDTSLVEKGTLDKSIVGKYVWEQKKTG
jgi:hypothetical protein